MVGAGHSWFHVRQCLEFQEKRDQNIPDSEFVKQTSSKLSLIQKAWNLISWYFQILWIFQTEVWHCLEADSWITHLLRCTWSLWERKTAEKFVGKISENGEEVSKKTAKQTDRTWCFCLGHCYFSEILGFLQVGMVELAWLRRSCSTKNNKHQIWATSTRFLATLFSTGVSLKRYNRL